MYYIASCVCNLPILVKDRSYESFQQENFQIYVIMKPASVG